MVNVAGRSKGCATCRRRKVKCDLTVPQCRRCVDMGLVCPGPRTGAFFVHAIGDQSATSNVASSMSTTVTLPGTSQLDELSQAASQMPQTQALQSCRATAFDQLFTSHFIESFGLKKTSFTTAGTVTWLDRLPVFMESPDDCRVKSSIRSTSMLSYGTWVRDVSIQTEAYRWYARALTELRGRISLTTASAVESTVCAAVMLLHFETWAGTSGGAWRQHVNGAASLIEAVGPAACRHGFMQRIFTHLRFQTCVVAMHENRQHAFAMPEWLSIPFSVTPKTLFDQLVDIFFSIQRCLVVARELVQLQREEDNTTWTTLLRTLVQETRSQLQSWELECTSTLRFHESQVQTRPNDEKSIGASSSGQRRTQPSIMDFTSVPAAALASLFHAASLIADRLLSLVHIDEEDAAGSSTLHASAVFKANEFISRDSGPTSRLGPIMMLPQLKIVSIWAASEEERNAARRVLQAEASRTVAFAEMAGSLHGYFASVGEYVRNLTCGP